MPERYLRSNRCIYHPDEHVIDARFRVIPGIDKIKMVKLVAMNADPKNIITWILILIVPVVAVTGMLRFMEPGLMHEVVRDHFAAVIGLPMAALLAAFIVVGLRHSEGSVKFEALGMKFEGASGQLVLWVFCFIVDCDRDRDQTFMVTGSGLSGEARRSRRSLA